MYVYVQVYVHVPAHMSVDQNPPLIVFIRSAISEYSIEIVGKLEKEGFRKVSGRFTGRI